MIKVKTDLTGQRFGRWTVVNRADDKKTPKKGYVPMWNCICDCGTLRIVADLSLRYNRSKSCGCLQKEKAAVVAAKNFSRNNQYDLTGEYGIGYTTKGEEFWFDLEDYEKIKDYTWYIDSNGYVTNKSKKDIIRMHQLILRTENDYCADHIHGKETRHDNRKSNLRVVTQSQNEMNKGIRATNTSGATGVWLDAKTGNWYVDIAINGEKHRFGGFKEKEEAINVRKEAEKKYFGEYSYDYSQQLSAEKGA